jgi:hypothetical protein
MRYPLPESRIVRGAIDATLSHQFHDADGDPDDPEGTVTVSVTRSDGTAVTTGAVAGATTAPRTVTVGVAELTVVDQFTAVWSLDGDPVATDVIDVVGGTIGSVTAITTSEASISAESADVIKRARKAAEDRFLSTQNRSPFERLYVQRFDGTGSYCLTGAHFPDLVEVRWAKVWTSATQSTSLTAGELAAIQTPDILSTFERLDRMAWQCGRQNIEVGYVFGMPFVPQDLRDAFYAAVREEVVKFNRSTPGQSTTFTSVDGVSFGLARPGQRGAIYGIDEIDAVWRQYADPRPMVA